MRRAWIWGVDGVFGGMDRMVVLYGSGMVVSYESGVAVLCEAGMRDRKSTRLNSSHWE